MERKEEKRIKKIIKEFCLKLGLEKIGKINVEDNTFFLKSQSEEPEIYIGKGGIVLNNIQYLLAKLVSRELGEKVFIDFDINNYKEQKINHLKEIAKESADEVALTKEEKILPPMSAYERRIIHLTLNERNDVETESKGRDPERRVLIKPSSI